MSAREALRAGDRIASYEIVAPLGSGGMGEVYRARDTRLGRDVALKILLPSVAGAADRLERFRREATAAALLSHPHICTLHEVGESSGHQFIVMEYVAGPTLRERAAQTPFTIDEVLDIGAQLADALEEAHGKQIVHRDLKPANVILTPRGVKVLDFGVAKVGPADDRATVAADLTQPGMLVGTPGYMAPEQVFGATADHRSDLFSLGVVLYELVTTRRPFDGASAADVIRAVVHDPAPPVARFNPAAPPSLVRLISKLIEKDRERRYQSAREVMRDLRAIRDDRAAGAVTTEGREHSRHRRWRMFAVTAPLLIGVAWLVQTRRIERPVAPVHPRVVMLPAKVYGADKYGYLADAVPATISSQLAQVPELDTKVPPSSLEVAQVGADLSRVAEAFDATTCVLSSITHDESRLVLTVQLVDPKTRRVWWGHEYQGPPDRYLALAHEAADGLRRQLVPSSAAAPLQAITMSSEAELAFRQGQYHRKRLDHLRQRADFDVAQAAFEHALAVDPKLADAAAEMAFLWSTLQQAGDVPLAEGLRHVNDWARKALEIDSNSAPGWATLAFADLLRGNTQQFLADAVKAATFGPRCSECHEVVALAISQWSVRLSQAPLRKAQQLDPLSTIPATNLAIASFALEQPSKALEALEEAFKIEPNDIEARHYQALVLLDQKRVEEARPLLRQLKSAYEQNRLPTSEYLDTAYAFAEMSGDIAGAKATLGNLLEETDKLTSAGEIQKIQNLAVNTLPFLARAGRLTEALAIVERGKQLNAIPPYDWLMSDSRLAPLRGDSRFADLLSRSRAEFDSMRRVLEQARDSGQLPDYLDKPVAELVDVLTR